VKEERKVVSMRTVTGYELRAYQDVSYTVGESVFFMTMCKSSGLPGVGSCMVWVWGSEV